MSIIDGNISKLEALIREELHDPDSIDAVSSSFTPALIDCKHAVELVFRAGTPSGGTVTLTACCTADNEMCEAQLMWTE